MSNGLAACRGEVAAATHVLTGTTGGSDAVHAIAHASLAPVAFPRPMPQPSGHTGRGIDAAAMVVDMLMLPVVVVLLRFTLP